MWLGRRLLGSLGRFFVILRDSRNCHLNVCVPSFARQSRERLAVRLHLNADAVDRLSGSVEDPSEWLRRHVHDQTSLAVPALDRLHDIAVRRQFSTIWSKVVYRSLDLVEHEYRWPAMMMDGLFVVGLQGYLEHAKPLVLEDDFVVLWSRYHRIQCWIPSRWIQIRTMIGHVTLPSSVQRVMLKQCQRLPQYKTSIGTAFDVSYVPGTEFGDCAQEFTPSAPGRGPPSRLLANKPVESFEVTRLRGRSGPGLEESALARRGEFRRPAEESPSFGGVKAGKAGCFEKCGLPVGGLGQRFDWRRRDGGKPETQVDGG